MMTTDKESINRLVEICYLKGIRNVIFSPGSRNAPLVIAFHAANKFNIKTIPDERVAAFFALGQGIATRTPSVICCTSGSAVLNYAPAIVEAFYQRVPLLVLTADRPAEWIEHGIGQCMRQHQVYANYIKQSYDWIQETALKEDFTVTDTIITAAINEATSGPQGPVHINIPFDEPLYEQQNYLVPNVVELNTKKLSKELNPLLFDDFKKAWLSNTRKIIICGLLPPSTAYTHLIAQLSDRADVILLTETTSNIICSSSIQCIDRVLHSMDERTRYRPDLLISIGGPIVSKMIKRFLLDHKPSTHWVLSEGNLQDTYRANPLHLNSDPEIILEQLVTLDSKNNPSFQNSWAELQRKTSLQHDQYLGQVGYSDLLTFHYILKLLPEKTQVHLANSTPIRYAQLFDQRPDLSFYSNRGVSGIEGSSSTALGVASVDSENCHVLITGDISFFYDSNAFWQKNPPSNLKVILINNGGGGIFRYIPGPNSTNQLDDVFEAHHLLTAEAICNLYGLGYSFLEHEKDLEDEITRFVNAAEGLAILEIKTPREINAPVLKAYFTNMR